MPQEDPRIQEAKAGLSGLHPRVRAMAQWAIEQAAALGIPVTVTSGYRTNEEQRILRARWERGENPYPANKPGESSHNLGMSFDSAVPPEFQEKWNEIRKEAGFRIYPQKDVVHAELPDWKTVTPTARDRVQARVEPRSEPPREVREDTQSSFSRRTQGVVKVPLPDLPKVEPLPVVQNTSKKVPIPEPSTPDGPPKQEIDPVGPRDSYNASGKIIHQPTQEPAAAAGYTPGDMPLRVAEDAYGTVPPPQEAPQEAPKAPLQGREGLSSFAQRTQASGKPIYGVTEHPEVKRVSTETGYSRAYVATQATRERRIIDTPAKIPFGESVGRGLYSGIRRYAQIFGADPNLAELDENRIRESGLGHFTGEALAATPAFFAGAGAAGMAMKGMGMAARMTPLSYSITRSAVTGASLGVMKTPIKEFTLGKLAKNMIEEAALWTAFDAGILAISGKLGMMARTGREVRGIRKQILGGKEFVDPVLLKFEEAFFVNASRNWREVANRVHELWRADPKNSYAGLVAKVQREANAFGTTILHGLDEKQAAKAAGEIKKLLGDGVRVGPHYNGARSGIMVIDEATITSRSMTQRTSEALYTYQKSGKADPEMLVDLMRRGVADRGGLPPLEVQVRSPATGVVSARYEFSFGKNSKLAERRIRITMPKDADPRELLDALAHELTHDMILTSLGEVPMTKLISRIFKARDPSRKDIAAAIKGGKVPRKRFVERTWMRELRAAQRALHTRTQGSRKAGLEYIKANRSANDEFELLADFIQLVSRDRGVALHNAPTITQEIINWATGESVIVRSILEKEVIATEALLREYASLFGETAEKIMESSVKLQGARTSLRRIRSEQRIEIDNALAQFEREGVYNGMVAHLPGEGMMEVERKFIKEGVIRLRSKERVNGRYRTIEVAEARVQLPTVEANVLYGKSIKNVVANVLRQGAPATLGVTLRDGRGGLARAYFESKNMLHFKGNHHELIEKIVAEKGDDFLKGLEEADGFIRYAKEQGKHGVFMDDEVSMHVFADPTESAIHYHDLSPDLVNVVNHSVFDREFVLSAEDVIAEGLYQAGIPLREVENMANFAMRQKSVSLKELIDHDFAPENLDRLWEDVLEGVEFFNPGGQRAMRHGGGRVQIFPDGSHRIFVNENEIPGGQLAAIMDNATASKRYIANMAPSPGARNFSEGIVFPEQLMTKMNPKGGAEPLRFGETAESRMGAKALDAANDADRTKFEMFESGLERAGEGAKRAVTLLTSSRTYFQELEKRGMGPLFTDLWQRSQVSMLKIKTRMSEPNSAMKVITKGRKKGQHHSMLSGTKDYQRRIQKDVIDERRGLLTQLAMAPKRTIDDIMPLNEQEKVIQGILDHYATQGVDMTAQIPRLAGNMQAAERYLRDPSSFIRTMKAELRGSPTEDRDLARSMMAYKNRPGDITVGDILEGMGHTAEASRLIQEVSVEMAKGMDVDLFAIARHYSGQMNRAQFIAKHNMTPKEITLSDELIDYVREGMRIPGDLTEEQVKQHADTFLKGILPEVENFVSQGFDINHSTITKFFGEHKEFLHRRMISGDLNVYVNDPGYLAWRVMRGKLMQAEWEPVRNGPIKDAMKILGNRKGTNSAPYHNAEKYLQELEGIPHESFAQIEEALMGVFETVGLSKFLEPTILRDLIQKMNMVTYKATIPFRPLLLVRNASEIYRVGGITGGRSLGHGIDYVINPKTRAAAFKEAWDAGALKPDAPVFTVDPSARTAVRAGMVRTDGPLARARGAVRTGQRGVQIVDDFAEIGMGFYQRVDEYTRAIAFHSMKHRIRTNMHLAKPGSWQKFIQRSKLSTFDRTEQEHFAALWNKGGRDEAINYASTSFADKALFLYGNANHPVGWGSSYGVLFGQFGTWPVQYKDFMINGLTRGTAKDKLEFAAWNLAAPYAAVKVGRDAGIDLNSWWGVSSLRYGGGPYADASIDVVRAWTGNDAERAMARSNLKRMSTTPVPNILIMNSFALNDAYRMLTGQKPPIELLVKTYDAPKD